MHHHACIYEYHLFAKPYRFQSIGVPGSFPATQALLKTLWICVHCAKLMNVSLHRETLLTGCPCMFSSLDPCLSKVKGGPGDEPSMLHLGYLGPCWEHTARDSIALQPLEVGDVKIATLLCLAPFCALAAHSVVEIWLRMCGEWISILVKARWCLASSSSC